MMLFPGISQIQSALIGMAAGAILAGIGAGVLVHKIDNGRYEALVAAQATASAKALRDEAKANTAFDAKLKAANDKAAALEKDLDAARAKHNTVLIQTIHDEGKKEATLAHCFGYQLPADVLHDLAR